MAELNVNIGSSLVNIRFRDDENNIISSCRINPADVKLAARFEEMADSISEIGDRFPENAGMNDMVRMNDELEEKICYVLGYDARKDVFGVVSATSIMENGDMFALLLINTIAQAIKPAVEKRGKAMKAAVERYAARYQ